MFDLFYVSTSRQSVCHNFTKVKTRFNHARHLIIDGDISDIVNAAKSQSFTKMFWILMDGWTLSDNFDMSWAPIEWDTRYVHLWPCTGSEPLKSGLSLWPADIDLSNYDVKYVDQDAVKPLPYDLFFITRNENDNKYLDILRSRCTNTITSIRCTDDIFDSIKQAANLSTSDMYWIMVDSSILSDDFDLSWMPDLWERKYVHAWQCEGGMPIVDGISLWPKSYNIEKFGNEIKFIDVIAADTVEYDIFFISYKEPNADANYEKLRSRYPNAKRVHGIKGIHNAHKQCAKLSSTAMFWTVDGDTIIDDDFKLDYRPSIWESNYLHLWYTRNPVNDLVYGYGGIKLWPKWALLNFDGNWLDFTTSVGNIKIIDNVVATTEFNTSAYDAWRSGFRESVKLCSDISRTGSQENFDRLLIWVNKANRVPFAQDTVQGARDGLAYFVKFSQKPQLLQRINDFEWIYVMYMTGKVSHPLEISRDYMSKMLNYQYV